MEAEELGPTGLPPGLARGARSQLSARRLALLQIRPASQIGSYLADVSEGAASFVLVFGSSVPRRQQVRRLRRAAVSGVAAIATGALAATAAGAGATALAGLLALLMAALVVDARHWLRLAARSGVGARSVAQVRRVLGGLEAEGWRLRHSLPCGGRGDIDSVAIAPTGVAFTRPRRAGSTHAT